MKTIHFLCLAGVIMLCSFSGQESPDIQGAWKFVSSKAVEGNKVFLSSVTDHSQLKMWTNDHFAFMGTFKSGKKVIDNYGSGTYTLNGNQYNETIIYHVDKKLTGTTIRMIIEIKGDTLIQTWPVNDEGNINPASYAQEKYIRP